MIGIGHLLECHRKHCKNMSERYLRLLLDFIRFRVINSLLKSCKEATATLPLNGKNLNTKSHFILIFIKGWIGKTAVRMNDLRQPVIYPWLVLCVWDKSKIYEIFILQWNFKVILKAKKSIANDKHDAHMSVVITVSSIYSSV